MQEITEIKGRKVATLAKTDWILIYKDKKVIQFASGYVICNTPASNTLLVGTQAELQNQIDTLGLK